MRVLLLDNRDSFVWNLAQAFGSLGCSVDVVRSDRTSAGQALSANPQAIVLSPGPGRPEEAGCSVALLQKLLAPGADPIPVLGVCLGHQAIGLAAGARIDRSPPCHGKAWPVRHRNRWPFDGLPDPIQLARYHSLVVAVDSVPDSLEAIAWTDEGVLMAIRHRRAPMLGLQFHPESFRSELGPELCRRFALASETFARTSEWPDLDPKGRSSEPSEVAP